MTKTSLFAALFVVALAGSARAGGQAGSLGVGAEYMLNGAGGPSFNYDGGSFHVGAFFFLYDPQGRNNTTYGLGARFFYHVHSTTTSDFGIGAGFGLVSVPPGGAAVDRSTLVYLEPGVQFRAFIVSNVALSLTTGLTIGVVDASGVALTGQSISGSVIDLGQGVGVTAGAGVHYYFF